MASQPVPRTRNIASAGRRCGQCWYNRSSGHTPATIAGVVIKRACIVQRSSIQPANIALQQSGTVSVAQSTSSAIKMSPIIRHQHNQNSERSPGENFAHGLTPAPQYELSIDRCHCFPKVPACGCRTICIMRTSLTESPYYRASIKPCKLSSKIRVLFADVHYQREFD